jgi:hypothetical protein
MARRSDDPWTARILDVTIALLGDARRLRRRLLVEIALFMGMTACVATLPNALSVNAISNSAIVVMATLTWCSVAVGLLTASPRSSFTLSTVAGGLWGVWFFASVWGTPSESAAMCGLIPLGLIGGTLLGSVAAALARSSLDALLRRSLALWSLVRAAWLVAIGLGASTGVARFPNLLRERCHDGDELCHAVLAANAALYAALAFALYTVLERALLLLAVRRLRAGGCLHLRVSERAGGSADDDAAALPTLDALPGVATVSLSTTRPLDPTPFRHYEQGRPVARVGRRAIAGVALLLVEIAGLAATAATAILR